MPIQEQHYQITGMKQDNLVGTGFSTKFAHEIKNMRLNTIGDYTTGAWTTEKGTQKKSVQMYTSQIYLDQEPSSNPITKYFPIDPIKRVVDLSTLKVLGQATINDQWILFGKIICNVAGDIQTQVYKNTDCILRLFISNNKLYCEVLYFGKLNFDLNHPIETLTYFENEDIQKVYFTDGLNQPRVINIVNVKHRFNSSLDTLETQFDFVREVKLEEEVTIKKLQSGSGLFPPCTVKYALTYYDKYGSETNVVYDSPLYYPTKGERGCSPEELSGDSFEITVSNLDTNFDYIRLYSIVRTSNDATPIVRIVADKAVPQDTTQSITFVDTNTTGEIIDPNVLRYVGGRNITAQTFDQKSNALFLGNIELKTKSVTTILNNSQFNPNINWQISSGFDNDWYKRLKLNINESYPYTNQLNPKENSYNDHSSFGIKHFKKGESYRFGLQFQDKYGVWSEVVHTSNMDSENTNGLKILYDDINHIATIDFTTPIIELPVSISETLYANDYRKVRLVCAKKNNTNRTILAQGVIDSTVWEMRTRGDNGPYAMTSWFFRPRESMYNNNWQDNNTPQHSITFGYNSYDAFCTRRTGDYNDYTNYYTEIENIVGSLNGSHKLPLWYVDREILTFHSPELEFDDYIKTLDNTGYKLRVVGYIPIEHISSSYYISSDFAPISGTKAFTSRYYQPFHIPTSYTNSGNLKSHGINSTIVYSKNDTNYGATLYPFKNNDIASQASYNYKIYGSLLTSNIPVFSDTTYKIKDNNNIQRNIKLDNSLFWKHDNQNEINLNYFKIFEKNDSRYTQIPISKEVQAFNDNNDTWYTKSLSYLVYASGMNTVAPTSKDGKYPSDSNLEDYCTKPIGLTYNTNTHGILVRDSFGGDDTEQTWFNYETLTPTSFGRELRPYLWLVNLEKEINTDTNVTNEVFVPCGPIIKLQTDANTLVYGLEGDHYFMRYDCLKTFPRSIDDRNQIVEILSFMTETRINLDGRYDNNRGLTENTTVTGDNFNLINKSYTQDNDFYQYTTLDDLSAKLDKFSNQITYTSVKIANEDVDAWTNITLANVDDADGSCGQITKILNINDKLFLFQDHGIARINYDEKTALSTDSGIPIELNSSGKYTGIDYINKNVGCQNKWSISNTKNGLMWVDDSRRELLALDESFTSITTLNGFDAFMINNCNTEEVWTPSNFNNFITFYDKLSKDIYFINKNTCLAWNEIPKTFTSFYDYNRVSALTTISNHTLMFRNTDRDGSIYAARESAEYSYFFNEAKPYWITLVCDGSSNQNNNFSLDKIFDTIEYRADIYNLNGDNTNYAKSIFNKKHVWNGYQDSEECSLDGIRKFNTWRVQLPRHKNTRDRIRNPFCYIKLKEDNLNDSVQTDRVILHDLAVSYTIK